MNEEELQVLSEFTQTDHYQISQFAKPILEKVKQMTPFLNTNGIKYSYAKKKRKFLGRTIISHAGKPDQQEYIILHQAYQSTLLKTERNETLSHEVAHVMAFRWKGLQELHHGFYWGFFMIALGYEPYRLASREKSHAIRRAQELDNLPQFKILYCNQCQKEVLAELINYTYTCPDCQDQNLQ